MNLQHAVDLFLDLVKIDAVSGKEKPVAQYIVRFLQELGLPVYEDDTAHITGSNSGNIICKVNGGGSFVLVAHMDTAYPTKGATPVILEDRILSNGPTILGADNRLGVAAILYAVKVAIEQSIPVHPFTVAFTTCEETTLLGSKSLQLNDSVTTGFVFDSYLPTGHFVNQAVGIMDFCVKIYGGTSTSKKGVNATQIAVEAFSSYPFNRTDADVIANVGFSEGDTAAITSDFITLHGELRSLNQTAIEEHVDKVRQVFTNAARKYGGAVEYSASWKFKPYHITPDSEPYKRIEDVYKSLSLEPKANVSQGGSDANLLNEKGIMAINLGIGVQNPHSENEFVLLRDIENAARIALELIRIS